MSSAGRSVRAETPGQAWLAARFVLSLFGLLLLVSLAAAVFREELEQVGERFVASWGYAGMAAGTLLADGFLFPVPPQFYMLLAVASNAPSSWVLASISAGSVLGGVCGYLASRKLGRLTWVRQRLASTRAMKTLNDKVGTGSLVALSLSPVAFSWLIYFCGFGNFRWQGVSVVCLLRIPKLVVYYWLVRTGWSVI